MLHHTYNTSTSLHYPEDNERICKSLSSRWDALKHDQDFYVIAVLFNPFLRGFFFNSRIHSLSRIGLFAVVRRVYRRMFSLPDNEKVPTAVFNDYLSYYDGKGLFTAEAMCLRDFREIYGCKVCIVFSIRGITWSLMFVQDTVILMRSIWRGSTTKFGEMGVRVTSIIANSASNERAFNVLGRTYSDKTRNLLNPERAHKALIVRRQVMKDFPAQNERKRRHNMQFFELKDAVARAAISGENIDNDEDDSDDEEIEDASISRNSSQHLIRALDKIADDGDDPAPDDDVVAALGQPRVRLHFGRDELYKLDEIFDVDKLAKVSPWDGSLRSYELNGEEEIRKAMEEYEEAPPNVPGGNGVDDAIDVE